MYIYKIWEKIRIYFMVLCAIFVIVSCLRFIFSDLIYDIFYISYIVNSIAITASIIIFNLKNGFAWYYTFCVIFAATIIMLMFFLNDIEEGIITVFLSYVSVSVVSTVIGGIMHRIRENNKEE